MPREGTEGSDYYSATTVDQIAAQHARKDTPLPSLELATELLPGRRLRQRYAASTELPVVGTPTMPLPTEADPRVVFERLFGDGGSAGRRSAQRGRNRAFSTRSRETSPGSSGGRRRRPPTRRRVPDSVREIERRIQKAEQQGERAPSCRRSNGRLAVPASWDDTPS